VCVRACVRVYLQPVFVQTSLKFNTVSINGILFSGTLLARFNISFLSVSLKHFIAIGNASDVIKFTFPSLDTSSCIV
jgi:hypothetical protein